MSYATELANRQFKSNVVVRINGTGAYYAKHQPDSGLSVPLAQRIVKSLAVNPQIIDLMEAKTSFASNTLKLIDKDNIITALFENNLNIFMRQKVEIWLGMMTGSFAWADYKKLTDTYIKRVTFQGEDFIFTTEEIIADLKKAVYNIQTATNAIVSAGAGTIVAAGPITSFPASGRLFLDNEFLTYSSKNNGTKTFTLSGVTANLHSKGAKLFNVTQVSAQNPVDILLRILQSTGGGTYDSYAYGLGIANVDLDIAGMEAIRDENFSGELFSFELYGIEDTLSWIEENILKVSTLRFISTADSKIGLSVLDQSIFGAATKTFSEANVDPKSVTYEVDQSLVRNVIEFRYGYSYETDNFSVIATLSDAESIANYDESDPFIIEAKGVPDTAPGGLIATDRLTRWLARLKSATPKITLTTFFSESQVLIGERVLVVHDLPNEIGTRDFRSELEVLKKGIDVEKGLVKIDLAFTNYSGLREAFISPSDLIATWIGHPTNTMTIVGDVTSRWAVGDKIRLVSLTTGITSDAVRTITSVSYSAPNTTIILDAVFDTTVGAAIPGKYIQYANYDECSATQRRYAYISDGAADFVFDATRPYQITF